MNLRVNVLANYASQFYIAVIGFALVPLYIRHMGAEAYGLVGLFVTMQAWFQLLDFGLSPSVAREVARRRDKLPGSIRALLQLLTKPFVCIAAFGCLVIVAGAEWIATSWLSVETLDTSQTIISVMLMGPTIALRFMSGLYRGVITGFERIVWLSAANTAIATARFVLIIPAFYIFGSDPTTFFVFQLLVSCLEIALLADKSHALLPASPKPGIKLTREEVRSLLRFALGMSIAGVIWVAATQVDKVALSTLLPLTDYAYFSVAALLAGAVTIIAGPVGGALLPRLTALDAGGNNDALYRVYRVSTRLIACLLLPAATVLITKPHAVLFVWSGDDVLSRAAAEVLPFYAAGNVFVALSMLPFYLQCARGQLRYHVLGNCLFLALFLPLLLVSTRRLGMQGAGLTWMSCNALYFLLWIPYVHRRLAPGLHPSWLFSDILLHAVPSVLLAGALLAVPAPGTRLAMGMSLVFFVGTSYLFTIFFWKDSRQYLLRFRSRPT